MVDDQLSRRLVRTIYVCRYVADEELRRRVRRQLNKGERLHALRRDLFFAHQGHVRRRHLDDQVDQALCLTMVTNPPGKRGPVWGLGWVWSTAVHPSHCRSEKPRRWSVFRRLQLGWRCAGGSTRCRTTVADRTVKSRDVVYDVVA